MTIVSGSAVRMRPLPKSSSFSASRSTTPGSTVADWLASLPRQLAGLEVRRLVEEGGVGGPAGGEPVHHLRRHAVEVVARQHALEGGALVEQVVQESRAELGLVAARYDARVARAALEASLQDLPAQARRVFMMREVLGLEAREIAEQLGISTNNCHVVLHRARAKLRAALEVHWDNAREAGPLVRSEVQWAAGA